MRPRSTRIAGGYTAMAAELSQPCVALALEMVDRSLSIFTGAGQRGEARAGVPYLAAEAVDLGIVTRTRTQAAPSRFAHLTVTFAGIPYRVIHEFG